MKDGEPLPIALKSQCNCEVYPQELYHNPNGRYGGGVYCVYQQIRVREW